MIANASFPPFNPNVTTDDVMQQGAWMAAFYLIITFFATCCFNEHIRTIVNMWKDEVRNKFTGELKDHPILSGKLVGGWWVTYVNYLLGMFFLITMMIVTWFFYFQRSNGNLVPGADDYVAMWVTISLGTWMFIAYCLCIYDVWNKHELYKTILHRYGRNDSHKNHENDNEFKLAFELVSIKGRLIRGMNGYTTAGVRTAIRFINGIIWGAQPIALGMIAASWDRSPNTYNFSAIPNVEAGVVGFTGVLLTLTWVYHSFGNLYNISNYYNPDGYLTKYPVEKLTPHEMNLMQIGLTSDTIGLNKSFKGRMPFQYCPMHFMLAKSFYWWALGYCLYNDRAKALALYLGGGVLPVILTFFSGNQVYYITFDVACNFFFFLFVYLNQGTFYYTSSQDDINKNLLTLNQSSTFPGMTPWEEWNISIMTIFWLSFTLAVISALRTVFGFGLPSQPSQVNGKEFPFTKQDEHPVKHPSYQRHENSTRNSISSHSIGSIPSFRQ